jgi:hypothetical protein
MSTATYAPAAIQLQGWGARNTATAAGIAARARRRRTRAVFDAGVGASALGSCLKYRAIAGTTMGARAAARVATAGTQTSGRISPP